MIGVWVKLLAVPFRYMYPAALFFIAIGVYSTNSSLFEAYEVLVFGIVGGILLTLEFPIAPILLGYVLGPLVEENFRRALLFSNGDILIFFEKPISIGFMCISGLLIAAQLFLPREPRFADGSGAGRDAPAGVSPDVNSPQGEKYSAVTALRAAEHYGGLYPWEFKKGDRETNSSN